ncbi:MAG: YkgJ family cysteine cluster protein [Tepidisphaeraceae bacterium]|jgi:Fe-S-cluster containining protein
MTQPSSNPASEMAIAHVNIALSGIEFETQVPVPKKPVPTRIMLPVVRAFTGAILNASEKMVRDMGRTASCKPACGACCRQLVPIALSETYELRRLVEQMPEPRRALIQERFAYIVRKLQAKGMAEKLREPGRHGEQEIDELSDQYFSLQMACPFLEEESCSIYPDRPIICREYLVTSDPEFCKNPTKETIQPLPIAARASAALMHLDDAPEKPYLQWIPLTLALEWAEKNPEPPPRAGTDLLGQFLECLGKDPESPIPPAMRGDR